MLVWRISRKPFVASTLDGTGGLYASGRWHHRGYPIVYAASSAALAALEVLVHVDPLQAPSDLVLITIDVPAALQPEIVPLDALPSDWRITPAPVSLQDLGTSWILSLRSAALQVPSGLVPTGENYLLNPRHPDHGACKVVNTVPFSFDPHLLRRAR